MLTNLQKSFNVCSCNIWFTLKILKLETPQASDRMLQFNPCLGDFWFQKDLLMSYNDDINTIKSLAFEVLYGLELTDYGANAIYKVLEKYSMDWGDLEKAMYIASEKDLDIGEPKLKYTLGVLHNMGKEKCYPKVRRPK